MYFIIILFFVIVISYLMVLFLRNEDHKELENDTNDNDFNSSKDPTELKVKSNTFIDTGLVPIIFSSNHNVPIARVPLRAFKAPMLKYIFIDEFPAFFRYKTEFLQPDTDQGLCGACWVFSVTSVLADKVSLYSKGKIKKRLSVQQLLSCYPNKDGCTGDSPEDLALWLDKNKIQVKYEIDYPYDQNSSTIIQTDCPSQYSGVKVEPKSVRSITTFVEEKFEMDNKEKETIKENIRRMKYELITKGPIYSAISVREDFYKYDGDSVYISTDEKPSGGHSIEIIGYCEKGIDKRGSDVHDNGYWICKNYWSNWPIKTKNGIFALKMGVNNCGIESRCGTLEPVNSNQDIPSETFYKTPENFHNYVRFSF
jgi:hypothetical protein